MQKILKGIGFWILSLTWGLPLTLVGFVCAIALLVTGHRPHFYKSSIYFMVGKGWGGFECGPIFIICEDASISVILHEWGHGIQNIVWGPLMIPVITIPSAIRYWYRELTPNKKHPPYDSIWFEGQATRLGYKYYNEEDLLGE